MNDARRKQLELLLHEHGLRGLVNLLADVVEEVGKRGSSLPYWPGCPDCPGMMVDPDDLEAAAGMLRHGDLY
jgi:hypothetical protein